ncbi:hypothetical protein E2C01_026131 [Portunus trituberculatus]|uniref:Uncharacterized protein n=1 Tax=Portunus trituberculatus TaxID=210409 RepID=A0A5B7EEN3_PORTR|nr:hypothetical protein [Portunus trituberculatus]
MAGHPPPVFPCIGRAQVLRRGEVFDDPSVRQASRGGGPEVPHSASQCSHFAVHHLNKMAVLVPLDSALPQMLAADTPEDLALWILKSL